MSQDKPDFSKTENNWAILKYFQAEFQTRNSSFKKFSAYVFSFLIQCSTYINVCPARQGRGFFSSPPRPGPASYSMRTGDSSYGD